MSPLGQMWHPLDHGVDGGWEDLKKPTWCITHFKANASPNSKQWTKEVYYIENPGMDTVWSGNRLDLDYFLHHCNDNNLGLIFTYKVDPLHLVFLNLMLTYYYLYFHNCHHASWKNNILTGQFNRLWHNCSKDYTTQSTVDFWSRNSRTKGTHHL